ncbi:uncharacterized protein LOC127249676 [Andrographis paniculata]|uniref:uncharacterized protein LOC127249676 n=1 Tax=Andrographis paniculata TaxID=175694 RepID=UPI0021E78E9B|nr:uncharacterized protein LOC127249676 [Andrographis paniculata]
MFPFEALSVLPLLFLVDFANCLSNENSKVGVPQISTIHEHLVDSEKTTNIVVHGILLWASMGFLMPLGILIMRISTTKDCPRTNHKILLYLHATLQVLSLLFATAAAVLSIRQFENAFNNIHQRIGLALYAAIFAQILISFRRPNRGTRSRTTWYFLHWMLGTATSLVGTLNIYTGLNAYHKKTSRSITLWIIIFTAQVCVMAILYMFQDKWEYMQKQGIITAADSGPVIVSSMSDHHLQMGIVLNDPSRKSNALGTYFSRTNALNKLFQLKLEGSRIDYRLRAAGDTHTRGQGDAMGEEESKASKKRVVESLGWLTESTIMPRKHRAIEGVGASSVFELKAQLYQSQEESKRQPKDPVHSADHNYAQHLEVHRAKKKISANDSFSAKNSGVDARAAKDKLELKAVKDGSASYAALERKAELYDKLMRGELSDEEDQEKYCVDFFRKGIEQSESPMPQTSDTSAREEPRTDADDGDDLQVNNTKAAGLGRGSATMDRGQHKHLVMEVHEEVNLAREKASELKIRRQEQLAARREKLKQAYLRKQLEKMKASKEEAQTEVGAE